MSRLKRGNTINKTYHVYNRGYQKKKLFLDEKDYLYYIHTILEYKETHRITIYSYSIMPNHIHFLLTSKKPQGLSKFMQAITFKYAIYHNKKYDTQGYVWQGRYKNKLVQSTKYFEYLKTYIGENAYRSSLVDSPEKWNYCSLGISIEDNIEGRH